MARVRPRVYDVCDWCGAERTVDPDSQTDAVKKHEEGWRQVSDSGRAHEDLCSVCVGYRKRALEAVKDQRRAMRGKV